MIIAWNTKNADKIREYNRVFNARKRAYKAAVKELFNCLV
jgi:hypothetical protein